MRHTPLDQHDIKFIKDREDAAYNIAKAKSIDNLVKGLIFVSGGVCCFWVLYYFELLK